MFLIWLNAEPILLFLNQEPEVAHLASIYLRWASLGLPGIVLNLPFLSFDIVAKNNDFFKPMHLIVSAGEQHLLQQQILISDMLSFSVATFNLKANRVYDLLQAFLFITVHDPGLFTVPTRIVFVAAPINALLNWLLGK